MNLRISHVFAAILGSIVTLLLLYLYSTFMFKPIVPFSSTDTTIERPLLKYSLEELAKRQPQPGPIQLGEVVATHPNYTTYTFTFTTEGKKVSGLANIPNGEGKFPVIVQYRGYVDPSIYETGVGTRRSGEIFANNGYITLAPDFLNYAQSDKSNTNNIFEDRFLTYTTALDMLAAIPTFPQADPQRVGIWGHSNGGHIALTVLAITGKPYPTTLWAPVTKPFPFSVLFYTDESVDQGKFIRGELARFEGLYDVNDFTFPQYIDRISAPIQLHQGTADDAVPVAWSDQFAQQLKDANQNITYYRYPGADHNMAGAWDTVVQRDFEFFRQAL
jgi:dipeptidyl aminopeptidase/acylaminoacyl peptidase